MVLTDLLDPGVNGAEFFVLICTKTMHLVQVERVTNNWDGGADRGNKVVHGLYYHQSSRKQHSYCLIREARPAILLSHLVIASNFTMTLAPHKQKGCVSVYQLTNSALAQITVVVRGAMPM